MALRTWNEFAGDLTAYVRKQWPAMHRGALLMPFIHDTTIFALVFGNNVLPAWDKAHVEVDLIRQNLRHHEIEDLGFGLSPDGHTWVLVARVEIGACRTQAGRDFQREMVKLTLEEAVRDAWWAVYSSVSPEHRVLQDEPA